MAKKIVVLNGSPTVGGNTETLAHHLAQGAEDAGHSARIFRLSDLHIAPYSGITQTPADDDMQLVAQAMIAADVIVLASPLYWMQFTAQMKAMMDRLGFGMKDALSGKEVALLACAASPEAVIRQNIVPYYQLCFVQSLGWQDRGVVAAGGVFGPGDVEKTPYAQQAYDLGRSL